MNLGLWGSISPKTILGAVARGVAGESSYSISGTVYDADGSTAVAGATVALGALSAVSAADGTYTISSVPPGTSGSMTCTKAGYSWTAITVAAMAGNLTSQNYTNAWWAAGGGGAGAVGIYRAIGAASLAASYINLANPGTNNLSPIVAPTFNATTGWTFAGAQGMDTGITPDNNQTWVMIVRFSDIVQSYTAVAGTASPSNVAAFQIQPNRPSNQFSVYSGDILTLASSNIAAGVGAVVANKIQINGVEQAGTISAKAGAFPTIYIGGAHHPVDHSIAGVITGKIQAVAIYSTLTAAQATEVAEAMALLPFDFEALAETPPPTAVYASDVAALDSNFFTGGGTDDTAALQAVLDVAQDGVTSVYLVLDGPALVTGLKVYSNTTIAGDDGGCLFLVAGSNMPVIRGGTPSKTVRTEHDIRFVNLYINGNGANQLQQNADGTFCTGISFYSVSGLTVEDCYIYDTAMYGVCLWNSDDTLIEDYIYRAKGTRTQQDGINLRSTTSNAVMRNIDIDSYDDAIAMNNIHWGDVGGPYVTDGGEISNVSIDGLYLSNALFGVDILSDSSLITGVTIANVTGQTQNYWLSITDYSHGTGNGNFGTISAETVNTKSCGAQLGGAYDEHIRLHGNIANLSLTDCRLSRTVDDRSYIRVFVGYTVTNFTLNGLVIDEGLAFAPNPVISIDGTVTNQIGDSW